MPPSRLKSAAPARGAARSAKTTPKTSVPSATATPTTASAPAAASGSLMEAAAPARSTAARSTAARAQLPSCELSQARARWHARQGLAAPAGGPVAAVIAATGWPRTLGGIDVYLATQARTAGLRRADLDTAVASGELQVVPAVRGCIYLVPRAEAALCLRIAEEKWRPRTERELSKAGTTWGEIDEVAAAARAALAAGPLTSDGLRRALPPGTCRSFGEAGKKVGLSSPLPLALRVLEFAGQIERTLPGGRLDTERYEWRLVAPRAQPAQVPATAPERFARLAALFFSVAAPATIKDFAGWAGLSGREAQAAVAALPLIPMRVPGYAEEALGFAADLQPAPPSHAVSFLSFDDNYLTLHGGPAVLTEPVQHGRALPAWGAPGSSTLGEARHATLRTVLVGPRIVGFWEYDPDARHVVYATFDKSDQEPALVTAAESLTALLRDELQHGRSFNLDTDDELRARMTLVQQVSL